MNAFYWREMVAVQTVVENARRDARAMAALLEQVIAMDDILRPVQVAEELGITRRYLQQLRKRAGLPPKTGGRPKQ